MSVTEISSSALCFVVVSNCHGLCFCVFIVAEGLEFPDMTIDVATQSVFVGNQPLPPIIGRVRAASLEAAQANLNVTFKQEEKELGSTEVSLVSNTGRDRAMSFEFFSFGINADEPLPPAPELTVSEVQPVFMRPRGDSIIFDPDSFRDGGILEEHALQDHALLKSRTTSLDLGTDELSLMNTPGFVPAPTRSVALHRMWFVLFVFFLANPNNSIIIVIFIPQYCSYRQ